jgi:subtilisin family serine protease
VRKVLVLSALFVVGLGLMSSSMSASAAGSVERLSGPDRYATSAAISAANFSPGVPAAYIANGTKFPDALSAAPVAGKNSAPVLLTLGDALPAPIQAELTRLKPAKIIILGDTNSIDANVATQLAGYVTSGPRTPVELTRSVTVTEGSIVTIDTRPELDQVLTVDSVTGAEGGLTAVGTDSGLHITASLDSAGSHAQLRVEGTGCIAGDCAVPFIAQVDATVAGLEDTPTQMDSFTLPSTDRIVAGEALATGSIALSDEVLLTLGTELEPGALAMANDLAQQYGAIVSAAFPAYGVYELRWPEGRADIDDVVEDLAAADGVAEATRSLLAPIGGNALPPGDWSDDGPAGTWHLTEVRAPEAWDTATGSTTPVGIVDSGTVSTSHEDLNVTSVLGSARPEHHATHVAGLACATANGAGVVGAGWGCPITTIGVEEVDVDQEENPQGWWQAMYKSIWQSANQMAASNVRVINMSLGRNAYDCVSTRESDAIVKEVAGTADMFRRLFNGPNGRDIVWTLPAGNNCGVGPHSPWGAEWALPNVITVAATNRGGELSSFSNFGPGVEVAAPGGVGTIAGSTEGVWSTSFASRGCGLFGWWSCDTYRSDYGTSMAAPVVAGVAALVIEANPGLAASEVGGCIVSTAGTDVGAVTSRSPLPVVAGYPHRPRIGYTGSIPRVNAEAAVACATAGPTTGDVLVLGAGDRTASGNGTDIGDVVSTLTGFGYDVVQSASVPDSLSGFGQIWYIDTEGLTTQDEGRLAAYVRGGHGLYLTGEWGCCSSTDSSIRVVNSVIEDDDVSFGGASGALTAVLQRTGSAPGPVSLSTTPNRVDEVTVAYAGTLVGVDPENVVAVDAGTDSPFIAAWGPDDVEGAGRIVIVMDINWLAQQYRGAGWENFAENIAYFLD